MDRHEPDTGDAQFLQVIQFGYDTLQVADAVAVAVAEGIDEDFVEGAVIVIGAFAQGMDLVQGFFRCGLLRGAARQQKQAQKQTQNSCNAFHHNTTFPLSDAVSYIRFSNRP